MLSWGVAPGFAKLASPKSAGATRRPAFHLPNCKEPKWRSENTTHTTILQARYNVAPSQAVETIIRVDGEKRLGRTRWGFG
jgi:hypothetical protein